MAFGVKQWQSSQTNCSMTVTAGNILLAFVNASVVNGSQLTATPVTDSQGQTWVNIDDSNTGTIHSASYYVATALSGSTTFTLNFSSGGFGRLIVAELEGCTTSSPLDQHGITQQNLVTGTNTQNVAVGPTTQNDEVIVGAAFDAVGSVFHTYGTTTGWTAGIAVDDNPGIGGVGSSKIVAVTGTQAFQFESTVGDTCNVMTTTWIKAAGGSDVLFAQSWM